MTLQECYAAMSGNYDDAIGRLRSERLVQKFVLKFLNDGSYQLLQDSLAAGNREEAFRAAHTLKGVTQNLSFTRLYQSSHEITEALRTKDYDLALQLLPKVEGDYTRTAEAIQAYQGG